MDLNVTELFCTFTLLTSWILGKVAKKSKNFNNYLIPIQNLFIGLCVAFVEWLITKDFKIAIAASGITAGGIYDILHNINLILKQSLKNEVK